MNNRRNLVYQNAGNSALLNLLSRDAKRILDVGCGAGDNARLLQALNQHKNLEIIGITLSCEEAALARSNMTDVHVVDLETSDLSFLGNREFDAIILSHVMEHMKDPSELLRNLVRFVRVGGQLLIAVPNVLEYKNRLRFLMGSFEYSDSGLMDRTHLRFFTWRTADRYLISPINTIRIVDKIAEGGAPLGVFRRTVLPAAISNWIDTFFVRLLPNLFGWQIIISAIRVEDFCDRARELA